MLRIGIVGLPQTGKTTLFQILTRAHGSGIGSGRQEAHVGVVRVPDARLDRLSELFKPQKTVHATIEYMDMPGSVIELARTGVQSQALRELDALVHVARAFEDEAIPLEGGSVDPKRDIENVELELILSDLAVVEKRLERLEKDIKKQKSPALEKEFQVLKVCKAALEKQTPLREVELGAEESKVIRGFTFLSLKPMLYVLNLGERRRGAGQSGRPIRRPGGLEAAVAHGRQCDLWQGGSRTGRDERRGRGGISLQLRIEGIGDLAPD